MADISTGADATVDEVFSYQKVNKLKNHYYGAAAPADPVAGVIWIDSDDDRTYIYDGAAWVEFVTDPLKSELDCGAHSVGFTQQTAVGDGTTTINWTLGNKFQFTFGAANETFTFTAPTKPCNLILKMIQDGVGSRTATWPASCKWPSGTAPTLSTGASAVDIIAFYFDGTNFYGLSSLDFS